MFNIKGRHCTRTAGLNKAERGKYYETITNAKILKVVSEINNAINEFLSRLDMVHREKKISEF